ncbi:hypothetical protein GA0061078_0476 [Bifidobacterium bohemicum]|uniref:Carbon starvation protein n=1 Tax=Bifidobacterium bohemicum DSM 22767 TaxID=1437606 RepID=A0A086ZJM3_9BIFI|nr:hypothetical protein [Bifidobacterium bohemicum]KFI46723.1 hypothetical protein BBOH_0195 [Bifidobacterium bohemicum DSM 22767]SCB79824.1 hypothetical protein GA0061078_0476 [Bifidobacterium bohemicum]
MKLSGHSQGVLYGLTAVACLIWLAQSALQAWRSGTFMTWPNLVFMLCLAVVVCYGVFAAVRSFTTDRVDSSENGDDADSDELQR